MFKVLITHTDSLASFGSYQSLVGSAFCIPPCGPSLACLYRSLNRGLRGGFNDEAPSGGTCCLDLPIPQSRLSGRPLL